METTRIWLERFRKNAHRTLACEDDGYRITAEERAAITTSLQAFQLGEASEGRSLRASAQAYAGLTGNEDYVSAITHLIREENRHSSYLGAFMRQQRIPTARKKLTDGAFRFIRRLAGIETNVRVLVTAELIALTYYECLGRRTGSALLGRICDRMLEEEKMHIAFQMQHIHAMNFRKQPILGALADIAHAFLLAGTITAVWIEHRRVLGRFFGFRGFFGKVWGDFLDAMDKGREAALRELYGDAAFERMEAAHGLEEAV